MDRTYERRMREESQWLRFVARQTAEEARRLRAEMRRRVEEATVLAEARPVRRFPV